MKLEIEVDDLTEFVSALNNSINALNNVYSSLYFGCDIPLNFEKALENKFGKGNYEAKCEHLRRKLEILKKVYTELEKKEKELLKNGSVAE